MTDRPEPFLCAKELPDALVAIGVSRIRSAYNARILIRAMRETGAPVACRYTVRASDAAAWILARPDWSPRGSRLASAGVTTLAS